MNKLKRVRISYPSVDEAKKQVDKSFKELLKKRLKT